MPALLFSALSLCTGASTAHLESFTLDKQRSLLQANLINQLTVMLSAVRALASDEAAAARRRRRSEKMNPDDLQVLRVERCLEAEVFEPLLLEDLRARLGFSVRPAPSTVPGAGRGAFCSGGAAPGTVLGLYPGIVYLPGHLLRSEGALEALYPDDELHLFARFDGAVLDARGASPPPLGPDANRARLGTHRRLRRRDPKEAPPSPVGVGHYCNHPPRGRAANVMALAVDFPSGHFGSDLPFPPELLPHVPNVYDATPSLLKGTYSATLGVAMPSVALLATQPIRDGDELFLDYRLSPTTDRPEWYCPVDPAEEQRRWASSLRGADAPK